MSEQKVNLKNPWLAAILAFLIPGAGHFYQRRIFKGTVYFIFILGIFFWGLSIGQWQVLYMNVDNGRGNPPLKEFGFYSQVFVGIPGLYAIYQNKRYYDQDNINRTSLEEPLTAPFEGEMSNQTAEGTEIGGPLKGIIELIPVQGKLNTSSVKGSFKGTLNEDEQIELSLGRGFEIDKRIAGTLSRHLSCDIVSEEEGQLSSTGIIKGAIPRDFLDYFGSPINEDQLQFLNGSLGKRFDLAKVFTWIAGLLNLLAIWDAFDGPAYGYGKEEQPKEDDKEPAKAA